MGSIELTRVIGVMCVGFAVRSCSWFDGWTEEVETRPDTMLGEENRAAMCVFEGVRLRGELFTGRGVEGNGTETGEQGNGTETGMGGFVPWAGSVEVKQVVKAGEGVPRCVDGEGGSLGDFGVGVREGDGNGDGDEVCECVYGNRVGE
ncbi:hypothetical protein CJF30_00005608 [Rutstroemia sp. NJR-2017a BBW]|nr:hypothetical protein CJF30_00005775 [Rutstroemia sp. NJR-2017a BBW]PQE08733.1 hypothetical protein CJF30_00005608 [Rutstroemia sp. NJR-2017a BBW]